MFKILSIITISAFIVHSFNSLNGQWKLIQYRDCIGKSVINEPGDLHKSIEVGLKTVHDSGTIKGHTISNEIVGRYILYNNNKIRVFSFGGTKVGEGTEWGAAFWSAMPRASSYNIKKDTLFLNYENDKKVMVFIKIKK